MALHETAEPVGTGQLFLETVLRPHVRIALNGIAIPDLPPTITSIERQAPMQEETGADRLTWRVTFSEPVQQ